MNSDNIVDNVVLKCSARLSQPDLQFVKNVLVGELSKYKITIEETSIIPYDGKYQRMLDLYVASRYMEGLAKKTCNLYRLRLTDFVNHLTNPLEDYKPMDISEYLANFSTTHPVSKSTLNGVRGIICTFFHWLSAKDYIDKDPARAITPIKYKRARRKPLTDDELVRLKTGCRDTRDNLIISMLYEIGCRVGEICGVKISDIDLERKTMVVTGKGDKTRRVYFQAETGYWINKYLQERGDDCSEYLLIKQGKNKIKNAPLTTVTITQVVKDIKTNANLKAKCTPHVLRHTYATGLLKHGADVTNIQKLLGHANIATTMIYADVDMSNVEADYRKHI